MDVHGPDDISSCYWTLITVKEKSGSVDSWVTDVEAVVVEKKVDGTIVRCTEGISCEPVCPDLANSRPDHFAYKSDIGSSEDS